MVEITSGLFSYFRSWEAEAFKINSTIPGKLRIGNKFSVFFGFLSLTTILLVFEESE